jgi:hypothetical protein
MARAATTTTNITATSNIAVSRTVVTELMVLHFTRGHHVIITLWW